MSGYNLPDGDVQSLHAAPEDRPAIPEDEPQAEDPAVVDLNDMDQTALDAELLDERGDEWPT